jgi:Mrr restriction endonuclease-like protein
MGPSIPKPSEVERAFQQLRKRLKTARRRVDEQAARRMRQGAYAEAERWMKVGQTVAEYASRVDAFKGEWKALVASYKGRGDTVSIPRGKKPRVTPVWKYYKPVLRALTALGGSGSRAQIEASVREEMQDELVPKDLAAMAKGKAARWQKSLGRARKPMVREGWIEVRGSEWRLTEKGRAAESTNLATG